jgi:hypothetical protein
MAGRRTAVVVGINKYDDPRVRPELKGAENDAKEVFARLQRFGSFDVDRSKHLLLGKDAKCENIRGAISDLFWKKNPCDIAVFYFSGHGFLDDYGNGYIAPFDHKFDDPLVCGIQMQELREYFLAKNNKTEALLILDCCHSGVTAEPQKGGGGATDMPGRLYDSLTNNKTAVIGSGKFILASSGADEKSREMNAAHKIRVLDRKLDQLDFDDLDKHDHGVMTYYLLEGMNGDAADGKEVRIGKLYDYVSRQVNSYREDAHQDFKVYDCVCSTYEQGPASQTMLVTALGKSGFDDLIQQGNDFINDTFQVPKRDVDHAASDRFPPEVVAPASLLAAIGLVDDALKLSPEAPEATALILVIDTKLGEYQAYVNEWLLRQKRTYLQRAYREEFSFLEPVVSELRFEALRKLEVEQGNLVMDLIRLSLGEAVEKTFNADMQKCPFSRARNKAWLAPPAAAAGGPTQ